MNYTNYLMKIEWLIEMVKQENIVFSDYLVNKLRYSRRIIFHYFDDLHLKGFVIFFAKNEET